MQDVIKEADMLLHSPQLLATTGELAMLSGIWIWMTPQVQKPSSHDVVYGDIYNIYNSSIDIGLPPTKDGSIPAKASGDTTDLELFAYRFGAVTNIMNGGLMIVANFN